VDIHVYNTLNAQHLETVAYLVERITGIRVRETVPDWGWWRRTRWCWWTSRRRT
jgi:hypothetical protein